MYGGAEHAIAEFCRLYPEAPLFTSVARPERLGPLRQRDIRTTGLQFLYRVVGNHQVLLSRMPQAIESIDLRGFDVILSSSHAVGKGIVPPSRSVHICYCHTPMRYAWEMEESYLNDFGIPRFLRGFIKRRLKALRRWDLATAKRVDVFIANSTETQERIKRIYARDSIVIPPPVSDHFFDSPLIPSTERKNYLALGRLVPYKKFDLLITLANRLQLPLTIAGTGRELKRLRAMAGPTVTFRGFVSDDELPSLYASAKAVLFPQYEDAGIVPLEAQACGTPVIALGKGGALDSVVDGVTGVLFAEQSIDALRGALAHFAEQTMDPEAIRNHARQFSATRFRQQIAKILEDAVQALAKS